MRVNGALRSERNDKPKKHKSDDFKLEEDLCLVMRVNGALRSERNDKPKKHKSDDFK